MSKKQKKDKVPRRQLVAELVRANERITALARDVELRRNKHNCMVRKMNSYRKMLGDLVEVTEAIGKQMKYEVDAWPST
jgi:hypothetical protein